MLRPPDIFATARLSARPARTDDAPAVFVAYAADPEVTRYLSWKTHTSVEPVAAYLSDCANVWATGSGQFAWLLFLKETGALAGSIGITLEPEDRALFGYVLAKKFWGHGLAAEALTFLAGWALAQPKIFRAWAYCDAENSASVRVMEKAGMTREGLLRRWDTCPNLGPEPRDFIVCAKVR
jgi:ribosomal-protein-alanine N-acetyltransferase